MKSLTPPRKLGKKSVSFYPDDIAESAGQIDFSYLQQLGITTLFVDLDGTIVERGLYDIQPAFLEQLRLLDMNIYIATNRPKSRDLKNLRIDLKAQGVIHPVGLFAKPAKRYFRQALADHGLAASEVAMVGDRLLQDILGANRVGIRSVLVYRYGRHHGPIDSLVSELQKLWLRLVAEKRYR